VTISDDTVVPGQRIAISGTGFVPQRGAGYPLVAIKPYDIDPPWAYGGPAAYPGPPDAEIWFVADGPQSSWSGTIDVPASLTPAGLAGGPQAGTHWLRILSGVFSTGDAVTQPITFRVPFQVLDRLELGLSTVVGPALYQAGTTFRPGATVTLRGAGYDANAPVTVAFDGTPLPASITTDAEGSLPVTARAALPGSTAPGPHTLTVSTAGASATKALTVTAPPTARLITPAVRPGGVIAYAVDGFTGVAGTGQKVAVVVDEAVLTCITAGADGAGAGLGVVPATTAQGTATVGFAAGTSCLGPTGPQNDLPGTRVTAPLTVSAAAPAAVATGTGVIGGTATVSGDGFPPGQPVTVTLDGAIVPAAIVTDAAGRFAGQAAVPAATAAGDHVLLFTAGGATAAAPLTVAAPVPAAAVPRPAVRPAAPRAARLRAAKGGKLTLTLRGRKAPRATVTIRTKAKVRPTGKGRKRIVTLARGRTSRVGEVTLPVTKDGKALLHRVRSVKVTIRVAAAGRAATTRTVTLKGRA
jgi:hypothetical protein